jgi:hypothetical protein
MTYPRPLFPAKAGIQMTSSELCGFLHFMIWVPAFAGMSGL